MEWISAGFKRNGALILPALYLFSALCYAVSSFANPAVIGLMTLIGETGMDILICTLSFRLFYIASSKRRKLFGIIATAFFSESFADGAYNLIQNVFNISNPTIFMASFFEIPFLIFLCLQAWIWWELFAEANAGNKSKGMPILAYAPFIVSSLLVIAIFVYFADWKIDRLSGEGLYQLADILAEAAGFALVSICLGTSGNKAFSSIAIGFLIIVCSNYMIRLPVVALATTQNSPFEFTWIVGQLLIFSGLLTIKKAYPDNPPENWCYGVNCLQSQIVVGSFSLELLAIALFSIFVKYATPAAAPGGTMLKYLPAVMIILSIITVIISSYFSRRLLKPLKELEAAIEEYSSQGKSQLELSSHDDYGILEYIELKAFIKKALFSMNEKLTIERETSSLAANLAHDIASPLAVMEIILHTYSKEFSSSVSSTLKDSIRRIRNITHNLLEKYRNPVNVAVFDCLHESHVKSESSQAPSSIYLPHFTEWAISQKQLEWIANPCDISLSIGLSKNSGWVLTVPDAFKRVISNLLNNAYEALKTERQIRVSIKNLNDSFLELVISDSGCGLSPEQMPRVLEGESLKHPGRGLGLSGAKSYIKALGGRLDLASQVGKGTQVKLIFPKARTPVWFPEGILLNSGAPVIFLGGDEGMCATWRNSLKLIGMDVFSFMHADKLLEWCREKPEILKNAVYLFDFHLHDPLWTGLSLLEKLKVGSRGYLVTNGAEDVATQQRCLQQGIWLIPKRLTHEIPIKVTDSLHLKAL